MLKKAVHISLKAFYWGLCSVIIVFSLLISIPVINMNINNMALYRFSKQLFTYPLPVHTSIMEKQTICGLLSYSGDGMEFMTVMLVKSDRSLAELTDYYNAMHISPAKIFQDEGVCIDITVEPVSGQPFTPGYCREAFFDFDSLKGITDYAGLYYIAIHDGSYWGWFDPRGT